MRQAALSFCSLWLLAAAGDATKADLKKPTQEAFDRYIQSTEAGLDRQLANGPFLWVDGAPNRVQSVRGGKILVEPKASKGDVPVPDGLIHDWIGAVFIPGATLEKTLALLQDYDNHKNIYKPEVRDSKVLSHSGNDYKVFLRLVKKKVLTIVLNTYHDAHYVSVNPQRSYSRSYSTRIAEVDNSGRPDERELSPGQDHGFLWKLDSFWRFEERDGGVYVECEAVTLTRAVPTGLGWLINPIVRSLPEESLVNTLRQTREAL